MPYIQGSRVEKKFKGSFDHRVVVVEEAIKEHYGEIPVDVLATHSDHAFVLDGHGRVMKVKYDFEDMQVVNIKVCSTKEIPVIEDEDVPAHVSEELKKMVEGAMGGEKISRTQVREVSQLLDKQEVYWLTDVLSGLEEAVSEESKWYEMYQANEEKIRTSLYGSVKDIEGAIPRTRFSKIKSSQIGIFESEMKESLSVIGDFANEIVDECSKMVFDKEQEEFFGAISDSLIVEAQAINRLLVKAGKLIRRDDLGRIAEAHDKIAERGKIMAVVSGYLKKKTQSNKNEE